MVREEKHRDKKGMEIESERKKYIYNGRKWKRRGRIEKKGNIRRLHEPKWGKKRRGKEGEREGKKRGEGRNGEYCGGRNL